MNHIEQKVIVFSKIEPWVANSLDAERWFQYEVIQALGSTPEEAIKNNNFEALINYLEGIEIGGFA